MSGVAEELGTWSSNINANSSMKKQHALKVY